MSETTKKYEPKDKEAQHRRDVITKYLYRFDRPIIHVSIPEYVHAVGKEHVNCLQQVRSGDCVSFTADFTMMQLLGSPYQFDETLSLKNLPIEQKVNLKEGDVALVTDSCVLCTFDIGLTYKHFLQNKGISNKQIYQTKQPSKHIGDEYIVKMYREEQMKEDTLDALINKCVEESIPVIGVDGLRQGGVRLDVGGGVMKEVGLNEVSVGDTIMLGCHCINQQTGESIEEYDIPTMVLSTCQIDEDYFVLTEFGLVTDADLSFELEIVGQDQRELDDELFIE